MFEVGKTREKRGRDGFGSESYAPWRASSRSESVGGSSGGRKKGDQLVMRGGLGEWSCSSLVDLRQ